MVWRQIKNYFNLGLLVAGTSLALGCGGSASRQDLTDMLLEDSTSINDGGKSDALNDGNINDCQEWTTIYEWPEEEDTNPFAFGRSVAVDSEGNIVVTGGLTGYSRAPPEDTKQSIIIAKLDPQGNKLWTQTHPGVSHIPYNGFYSFDWGEDVAIDPSNNIYVIGQKYVEGEHSNAWIQKMDPKGKAIWTEMYNGSGGDTEEVGRGIALDTQGNVLLIGAETSSISPVDYNIWMQKRDADGVVLWTKYEDAGYNGDDAKSDIATDKDDNVFGISTVEYIYDDRDIWMQKRNADGDIEWTRTYDGGDGARGRGIAVGPQGNVTVVGDVLHPERHDIWVHAMDTFSNGLWTQYYNGLDLDWAGGVATDAFNNTFFVGQTEAYTQDNYIGIAAVTQKLDPGGKVLWTRLHGEIAAVGYGIAVGHDHAVFITGWDSKKNEVPNDYFSDFMFVKKYCD